MHASAAHASEVIFGWSPLWVATALFALTYAVIMSEKVNRAIIALTGAGLVILLGVAEQKEAMNAVDFNTLGLLLGMMLIVNVTRRSGLFQYVAIWSAKKVRREPLGRDADDVDRHRGVLGAARQRDDGAARPCR